MGLLLCSSKVEELAFKLEGAEKELTRQKDAFELEVEAGKSMIRKCQTEVKRNLFKKNEDAAKFSFLCTRIIPPVSDSRSWGGFE